MEEKLHVQRLEGSKWGPYRSGSIYCNYSVRMSGVVR